jgi:hypothetical protein
MMMNLGTTNEDKSHMYVPPQVSPKRETVGWGASYFLVAGFIAFAVLHEYLYREQKRRRR